MPPNTDKTHIRLSESALKGTGGAWVSLSYLVTVSPNPHEEVIRLDVSMNEVLVVDILNPSNHLREIEGFRNDLFIVSAPALDATKNSTKPY